MNAMYINVGRGTRGERTERKNGEKKSENCPSAPPTHTHPSIWNGHGIGFLPFGGDFCWISSSGERRPPRWLVIIVQIRRRRVRIEGGWCTYCTVRIGTVTKKVRKNRERGMNRSRGRQGVRVREPKVGIGGGICSRLFRRSEPKGDNWGGFEKE